MNLPQRARRATASATLVAASVAGCLLATTARAADYAGTYRGDIKGQPSEVDLSPTAGGYAGAIHLGSAALPCQATEQGSQLTGTFVSGGHSYPFTASLAGDTLSLSTSGATYTLTRPAPANPLAPSGGPAAGGPATGAPAPPAVAGDVAELARTATGRALVIRQPGANTAMAALDATLPKLAPIVGGDVTVNGRFADSKQPDRGGASFSATVGGRAVRGVAFCGRSTDGGEDVTVAYCANDAPPDEWVTLTAALPHQVALHEVVFPDGTGSVGLPEGWTCPAQSACDLTYAEGPDHQRVIFCQAININGTQSQLANMIRSTEAMRKKNAETMRRMNAQVGIRTAPPAGPTPKTPAEQGLFFGDPDEPVAMLQQVYPQLSECSVAKSGRTQQIDQVVATTPATAQLPGGRAALISLLWSMGGDKPEHFRFEGRIAATPVGPGATMLMSSGLQAHVDTFGRDVPTMWAVAQSLKLNGPRMMEVTQQRCQQIAAAGQEQMKIQNEQFQRSQQSMFERNRQYQDAQAERFDRFEQGINNQNLASHRAATDFTEMIGGYQKVVNTRTGEERSVDYYNSTGIVAGLNEQAGDNSEWVAVHLRDERYPLTH
jgi:hypothetical protein